MDGRAEDRRRRLHLRDCHRRRRDRRRRHDHRRGRLSRLCQRHHHPHQIHSYLPHQYYFQYLQDFPIHLQEKFDLLLQDDLQIQKKRLLFLLVLPL